MARKNRLNIFSWRRNFVKLCNSMRTEKSWAFHFHFFKNFFQKNKFKLILLLLYFTNFRLTIKFSDANSAMFFAYIIFTILSFVSLFLQMNTVNKIQANRHIAIPNKFYRFFFHFAFSHLQQSILWLLCSFWCRFWLPFSGYISSAILAIMWHNDLKTLLILCINWIGTCCHWIYNGIYRFLSLWHRKKCFFEVWAALNARLKFLSKLWRILFHILRFFGSFINRKKFSTRAFICFFTNKK